MGTEYTLWKSGNKEVTLDEMSNRLGLCVGADRDTDDFRVECTPGMEPAEMLKLLMEGIKCTSYWMSEEEFNEVFNKLEVYPY